MKKQRFKPPTKIIFSLVIILLAIALLIGYIWKVLTSSDYFTVKQVVVRNSGVSFDYLKGKNIFTLNLRNESWRALIGCPDCRKVRFARIFPNCVFVDFLKRQPVALVKFYKYFSMDDQGIFFYPSGSAEELTLPVIYGLETKIFGPKPGVRYNRPEINLGLSIIREFRGNKVFRGLTIKRIDLGNTENAGFFVLLPRQVPDFSRASPKAEWLGFEVRIGENNIKEKMIILSGLMIQSAKELPNIKYIDLRFKEPVIKFQQ